MSTYRYDIGHWRVGHIPRPKKIEDDPQKCSLVYWTYVNDPPRIKESEFKKIRNLQKEVYFNIIELKVSARKKKFLYDLEHSGTDSEKQLFELEIESIQNGLNDPGLLKKVKLGKWDRTFVTSEVYNIYNDYKELQDEKSNSEQISKKENIYGASYLGFIHPHTRISSKFSALGTTELMDAYINQKYLISIKETYRSVFDKINSSDLKKTTIERKDSIDYEKLKEILDRGDSITAGKIKLVQHVREKFDLRTEKLAFEKASELYSSLHNGHKKLYKDLGSYQSAKSQYFNRKLAN